MNDAELDRLHTLDNLIANLQTERQSLLDISKQELLKLLIRDIKNTRWKLYVKFASMLNSGHTFEIHSIYNTYNKLRDDFWTYYSDLDNVHIVRDTLECKIKLSGTPENILKFIRKYNLKVDIKDTKLVIDMHFRNISEINNFMKEIENDY